MSIRSDLRSEHDEIVSHIQRLEKERDRPLCTQEQLGAILEKHEDLQDRYDDTSSALEREQSKSSHSQISMFKQVCFSVDSEQ